MKNYLLTEEENPEGLHQRFYLKKLDGTDLHPKSEYFILRLDPYGRDKNHVQACRIAVNAYADAIEAHLPKLAADLRERYPLELPYNGG